MRGYGTSGATALTLVLAASFSTSALSAQERAEGFRSDVQGRLQSIMDDFHAGGTFPGANAAVSLPDGSVLTLPVGEADTTLHLPMTSEARMPQGSVGKTYFASVAMRLVGEGTLDLDAPVSDYLGHRPWYSRIPNAASVTVRNLMTHTSGVMRYEFKEAFTHDLTAQPEKRWKPEELVAYVLDEEPAFAAGEGWEYSDTNFILLGMIIEEITGQPCYDLIESWFLDPLGLDDTVPNDSRVIPGIIQGYAGRGNPFGGRDEVILPDGRFVINPQFEWAGGGFSSTAADLARWARFLFSGKAVEPKLLEKMLDGVPARLGPETRYGLGVIIRSAPGSPSYGHSGFFPGYVTEMAYFPELDVAVAVQVNTSVGRSLGRSPLSVMMELAEEAAR